MTLLFFCCFMMIGGLGTDLLEGFSSIRNGQVMIPVTAIGVLGILAAKAMSTGVYPHSHYDWEIAEMLWFAGGLGIVLDVVLYPLFHRKQHRP